jgi:hypothetical protein
MNTPVALLIFNRPDLTARVFEEIRRARPKRLLIVADGPRTDRSGEDEKCFAARAVAENVDWPCEVLKNYSDRNLGCKRRVSSGLDWVFQECEEAIILEDDCLPDPTFFPYCEELLDHYRLNQQVMHIGGSNFVTTDWTCQDSYYFSRYPHIWGWATWKRAWIKYDVSLTDWAKLKYEGWLSKVTLSEDEELYWHLNFQQIANNEIDTWDAQWLLTCWKHEGISVLPGMNLIENIGFREDATHTLPELEMRRSGDASAITFPLRHPSQLSTQEIPDRITMKSHFVGHISRSELLDRKFWDFLSRGETTLARKMMPRLIFSSPFSINTLRKLYCAVRGS